MIDLDNLSPDVLDALIRNDFASFVRGSFAALMPGAPLEWDPYLDLVCSRLQSVIDGDIRRLIITLPPRHLKSICVSVALPAYFLGHNPTADVMAVSYGQELSNLLADQCRTVLLSPFYQGLFGTRLAKGRQPLHAMKTTEGGVRRATSLEGAATGVGADLLIFDDPQKASQIMSGTTRAASNEIYRNTFISRANTPSKSRTVIVMQRLHEDDFVGFVLGLGPEWHVLNLPAIAEDDEAYPFTTILGDHVYRRAKGAALHPGRLPLDVLEELRSEVGESHWAGQYQQRPAPAGGGIVHLDWFKRYAPADLPTRFELVVQSWDTANKPGPKNDYSVCTTWGLLDKRIYLLDVYRARLEYPVLKRKVVELAKLYGPTRIIVEEQSSGIGLVQDLKHDNVPYIEGYKPLGDKESRMTVQAAHIESGFVYIPLEAHWLEDYLHEMAVFPRGTYDDQVDSTSQALEGLNFNRVKGFGFLDLAERELKAIRISDPITNLPSYAPGSMEYAAEQAALAEELKLAA